MSVNFTIDIAIDSTGLATIYGANLTVTLAQPVTATVLSTVTRSGQSASDGPPIAWLVFNPLASNQLAFTQTYYLSMTTTPLDVSNTLQTGSMTSAPVQTGLVYAFKNGSIGGPVSTAGVPQAIGLQNQTQGQTYSFGLAQGAKVNGTTQPNTMLDAVSVPWNLQASFYPPQSVMIFLSGFTQSGTVMPYLPSTALSLPLDVSKPNMSVGFNDATNTFYLISAT
jgi:hypothetical protein